MRTYCFSVDTRTLPGLGARSGFGGKTLLWPAERMKDFFNKIVAEAFPLQQPNGAETGAREEAINQGGGGGKGGAATQEQEEGMEEGGHEDMNDEEMEDAETHGGQQELQETNDPIFNVSTGCLAWTMNDVAVADEAGGAGELPQQGIDGGGGLIHASQTRGSSSNEPSSDSDQ